MPYTSQIRNLPKVELHLHLTGAYPLSYLQSIACDEASKNEYTNFVKGLETLAKGVSYHDAFQYFLPVAKLVNTYKKVEEGVIALGKELLADGVVYVEIRTGLRDLGKGVEEYLQAVLKGIDSCPKSLKIKLLLSLRRNTDAILAQQTVDLAIRYKDKGIVGIDISGDSTHGETTAIYAEIKRAKKAGLYIALHLGESPEEIDTPEKEILQAEDLYQLQPDRIGHAVFLSPLALKWILDHPLVPIEVCPTSSVLAGMMDHHKNHPGIAYYLQHNHPIVIGTDDPLLFKTSLTAEYRKLMELDGITIEKIQQMIQWSFDFAFLPEEERVELYKRSELKQFSKENYIKCSL